MHTFLDIQKKLVTNITAHSLEMILWDLVNLRNILLELKLVNIDAMPKKPVTFFQKIVVMRKYNFYLSFVKTIIFTLLK